MLLSKIVTAILIDFVTAQDLSNEYASQNSRKYKQFREGKDNILNNFDAPASVLKEIELEFKFAVTDLNEISYGLDVEETWGNCRSLAKAPVNYAVDAVGDLIKTLISDISALTDSPEPSQSILSEAKTSEPQPKNNIKELQDIWQEVRTNLTDNAFIESVNQKIYQKLFQTCKSIFLRGYENININTVKEIVQDKLEEGILEHPDFQEAIKSTQEIVTEGDSERANRIATLIQDRSSRIFGQAANTTINERNVRMLIQKLSDVVPHADIMVTPTFLRELPIEVVSSLKIKAQMDGYQWTMSETSETLHKVKNK